METNESQLKIEKVTRKGIHKFFHVSRMDAYFGVLGSIGFLTIILLKVVGIEISFISWVHSLELAILFGIFSIVARMYYNFYEERYDK